MSTRLLRCLALLQVWVRGGNGCYLLAASLLLPVWAEPTLTLPGKVQDALFVIDISESMNVPDVEYPAPRTTRLELAKAATREAMSALTCGSRVSVALFAGEQVVMLFDPLEICRHFPAIEQVVSRLTTHMRWIGDSRIEVGLTHAIEEARTNNLNVVFISDGDEMPHRSAPRLTGLEALRGKAHGVVLAVGGEALQPVPRVDVHGQPIGYWTAEEAVKEGYHPNLLAFVDGLGPGQKAPEGSLNEVGEHLSMVRVDTLKALATASGLEFKRLVQARDVLPNLESAMFIKQAKAERDIRWIFALIAGVLVLTGWFWDQLQVWFSRWWRATHRRWS